MSRRTIRPLRLSLLVLCLAACDTATPLVTETDTHDDGHGAATPAPTRPDAALSRRAPPRESEASANYERWPTPKQHAWVVNSFGFLYPSNEGHVDALDLDRHVSLENSPGADWCTHSDYTGPNGDAGIDYQFLRVIERFESLAQDNIADVIVDRAVRDGSMTLLVTLTPLNEPNNERYQVGLYSGADRPLTGSDGEVQAYSSFALHEFTGYHNDLGDATMHDGRLQSAGGSLRNSAWRWETTGTRVMPLDRHRRCRRPLYRYFYWRSRD